MKLVSVLDLYTIVPVVCLDCRCHFHRWECSALAYVHPLVNDVKMASMCVEGHFHCPQCGSRHTWDATNEVHIVSSKYAPAVTDTIH